MECFLHLGFHKTGTSSMQSLLAQNRDRLGPETALLNHNDPELWPVQKACVAYVRRPDAARGARVSETFAARLAPLAARGVRRVLVSSEMLLGPIPAPYRPGAPYAAAPELAARLVAGAHSAGYRPHLCLYVRNRNAWADSLQRHLLRSRGLRESVAEIDAWLVRMDFDLRMAAEAVAARTGGATILALEDEIGLPLGPGTGFLQRAGFTAEELAAWKPVPRQNVGLSRQTVALMAQPALRVLPRVLRRYLARMIDRRRA